MSGPGMSPRERIYLDYNSTTPLLPEVLEAMRPSWLECYGNPSSAHRSGSLARRILESARADVAEHLGADADEVIFTSGATEANNLALLGRAGEPPGEILLSPVEHPSVQEPCHQLAQRGHAMRQVAVDVQGKVVAQSLQSACNAKKGLVTVQLANHETGTIQDLADLVQRTPGVPFHTDATQAVGKIPVHFHRLGVTSLACSAHKFFGPKGIGVLLVKRGHMIRPLVVGGHQQAGLRPGTEPVPLAVGMAAALRLASRHLEQRREQCLRLRKRFLQLLRPGAEPFSINGDVESGLVHTLNLSFPGCPSDLLLIRLDLAGIDCSTGSACYSGSLLPSPVLQAMGCSDEVLASAMRFSFGHDLALAQVEEAARRVVREVQALRRSGQSAS
jgi:cysteine desulfurase